MKTEYIVLIVVLSYFLAGVGMLFLGGRLIRYFQNRGRAPNENSGRSPSRIIDDLRPLQNLIMDFFGRDRHAAGILRVLARHQEPIGVGEIRRELQLQIHQAKKDDIPSRQITWATLCIMRMTDLIYLGPSGVLLTNIGREVERRINDDDRVHSTDARTLRRGKVAREDGAFNVSRPLGTASRTRTHIIDTSPPRKPERYSNRRPLRLGHSGIGELRKPRGNADRNNTSKLSIMNPHRTEITHMKKRTIIITAADHEELIYAIAAAGKLSERGRSETNALEAEIARAKIVDPSDLPPDVITMNSRAELLDLDTGERMEFTLVFPIDADIEAGKISVLAPLGTAMLGYRVNEEFEWAVPYGLRRLKIIGVHFQPEAALRMAA